MQNLWIEFRIIVNVLKRRSNRVLNNKTKIAKKTYSIHTVLYMKIITKPYVFLKNKHITWGRGGNEN